MARFTIYPDYWEAGAGRAPTQGPIDAPSAHAAYHAAKARGLYPAGAVFGMRVVRDGTDYPLDLWNDAREARAHTA